MEDPIQRHNLQVRQMEYYEKKKQDPAWVAKRRAYCRKYQQEHKEELKAKRQEALKDPKTRAIQKAIDLERHRVFWETHREEINAKQRAYYAEHIEEEREKHREYYAAHKEYYQERVAAYKKDNPEKCREYARTWREKHPEKCKEYARQWREKNREKIRAYDRERRARVKKEAENHGVLGNASSADQAGQHPAEAADLDEE